MGQYAEDFFGKWIGMSAHRLSNLMTRTLQKNGFDMTHEQLILLFIISREKGINQKQLAQKLDRDKTSIARSISKLERDHRVVRIQTEQDKRINNLYLTKDGEKLLKDIYPLFKEVREQLQEGYTQDEINNTVSFMKKLMGKVVELESKL